MRTPKTLRPIRSGRLACDKLPSSGNGRRLHSYQDSRLNAASMDPKNTRACRRTWNVKCNFLRSGELKSRASVSSPDHEAANRNRHQRGKVNNSEVVTAG